MSKNSLKFVIVGHVDHGKSTLIGRLLFDTKSLPPDRVEEMKRSSKNLGREMEFSFLMDHFKEEREQGITIDTTQTFFKTKNREYVIIDAPGHVEFLKNMITGASQAEAAILVVDAVEGIREQTKRHAYILSLLGLEKIIVAINKMDMIGYDKQKFEALKKEMAEFLLRLNKEASCFVPISAMHGDNVLERSDRMNWYQGQTVVESLDNLDSKSSDDNFSLIAPVQDVYRVREKRIIICNIGRGSVSIGKKIKIYPDGNISEVKSIESFLSDKKEAFAGENTGITIVDPLFVERGNIICGHGDKLEVSNSFRANLFWMCKERIKKGENITLKCTTQEVDCKIEKIYKKINSSTLEFIDDNMDMLESLEIGQVSIKTKKPVITIDFSKMQELGRFVLTRKENICAGGIITE